MTALRTFCCSQHWSYRVWQGVTLRLALISFVKQVEVTEPGSAKANSGSLSSTSKSQYHTRGEQGLVKGFSSAASVAPCFSLSSEDVPYMFPTICRCFSQESETSHPLSTPPSLMSSILNHGHGTSHRLCSPWTDSDQSRQSSPRRSPSNERSMSADNKSSTLETLRGTTGSKMDATTSLVEKRCDFWRCPLFASSLPCSS